MAKGSESALLIIDMVNDFVLEGAPLEVPDTRKIIKNIKREIERAREAKIPIIYVCDAHRRRDPEFRVYPPHSIKGTPGAKVIDELKPGRGDIIIEKRSFSGFYKTRLEETLRRLKVKELVLTGCVTNICVSATAADAFYRGYRVKVVKDGVAGLDEESHDFGLKQMARVYGAEIV